MTMRATMEKATFVKMAKKIFSGNIDENYVNDKIGGISIQNFDGWQDFFDRDDREILTVEYTESSVKMLLDAIEDPRNVMHAQTQLGKRIRFLERYGFHY